MWFIRVVTSVILWRHFIASVLLNTCTNFLVDFTRNVLIWDKANSIHLSAILTYLECFYIYLSGSLDYQFIPLHSENVSQWVLFTYTIGNAKSRQQLATKVGFVAWSSLDSNNLIKYIPSVRLLSNLKGCCIVRKV